MTKLKINSAQTSALLTGIVTDIEHVLAIAGAKVQVDVIQSIHGLFTAAQGICGMPGRKNAENHLIAEKASEKIQNFTSVNQSHHQKEVAKYGLMAAIHAQLIDSERLEDAPKKLAHMLKE